jgi:hypothetical protein
MEALCCATECADKQAQQPIKRRLSRTRQLRLVVEEGNEEGSAPKRLWRIGSTPATFGS